METICLNYVLTHWNFIKHLTIITNSSIMVLPVSTTGMLVRQIRVFIFRDRRQESFSPSEHEHEKVMKLNLFQIMSVILGEPES